LNELSANAGRECV